MTNFANLDTTVFDTVAKFFRTMKKAGADFTGPMQSVAKRRNLVAYLEAGCPKINTNGIVVQPTIPEGEAMTRLILGDDYLPAEETAKAFGFKYTDAQLEHLAQTMPTDLETLQAIKSGDCMLVAGPPSDTTLLGVRTLDNQKFYLKTKGWYSNDKEKFARTDVVKAATWMIVRKTPVADSVNKNWKKQLKLIASGYHVPNAPEMAYTIIAYFKVRGVRLFENVYVRTSSVDADGHRVVVGGFASVGLDFGSCWGGSRRSGLGVACARD